METEKMESEKQENQLNEQCNVPATLADLPVTDEQAQQVAGGMRIKRSGVLVQPT